MAGFLLPQAAEAHFTRPGVGDQIPVGKLDAMEDALAVADPQQKTDLLTRLGVEAGTAKAVVEGAMPGKLIEPRRLRTNDNSKLALAFLPGGTGGDAFIYLLQDSVVGGKKSAWHAIDHQGLRCWREDWSYELVPLRRARFDEVLLHHVNEGHGSGYVADQTQTFSVEGGKLRQTLLTLDYKSEEMMGTDQGKGNGADERISAVPGRLACGEPEHCCERASVEDRASTLARGE